MIDKLLEVCVWCAFTVPETIQSHLKLIHLVFRRQSSNSETVKGLIGIVVKGRILTGMGQKGSRREADSGSGLSEEEDTNANGVTTVEINHGFVKTRSGLIMAVQVYF